MGSYRSARQFREIVKRDVAKNNWGHLQGSIIQIDTGKIFGIPHYFYWVISRRSGGKFDVGTFVLPIHKEVARKFKLGDKVYVEGRLGRAINFNNDCRCHYYIIPNIVQKLKDFMKANTSEFYKNYTTNNRITLVGEVAGDVKHKKIQTTGDEIYKFKLKFPWNRVSNIVIPCTMFEGIKEFDLYEGQQIKVVGSMVFRSRKVMSIVRAYEEGIEYVDNNDDDNDKEYLSFRLTVQKVHESSEQIVKKLFC